jgi:hypothetical protein
MIDICSIHLRTIPGGTMVPISPQATVSTAMSCQLSLLQKPYTYKFCSHFAGGTPALPKAEFHGGAGVPPARCHIGYKDPQIQSSIFAGG